MGFDDGSFNSQSYSTSFNSLNNYYIPLNQSQQPQQSQAVQQQQQQQQQQNNELLSSGGVQNSDIVVNNNPVFQNLNLGHLGADKIIYEGLLIKQTKILKRWDPKYFCLLNSSLINFYDTTKTRVHRVFYLDQISISYKKMATDTEVKICLLIQDSGRTHYLYSQIPNQTEAWINALVTQKKILMQAKSNQFLLNSTPSYPSFPLSTSPPPYYNNNNNNNNNNNSFGMMIEQQQQQQQLSQSFQQQSILSQQQPSVVNNTYNFYSYQPQPFQPQYNIPIDRTVDPNILFNNNTGFIQQQQQLQLQVAQQQQYQQQPTNDVQWIQHKVLTTDTLAGIAIKYNTTIDVIKRINLIQGNNCISHQTLLVPSSGVVNYQPQQVQQPANSEDERKRKLIQLFAVSENISKEEARSYLVNNDWDFAKSIKVFRDDLDWESNQKYN
ncbi:hypothetical protein RB653_003455 [Dictyostelium firmibasis]|uniref:PH domain-containing protein n=1 Tax=Dictyostelium firmibasis TaxID=79012 RepID=A0AAN7U4P3_9MYCE